MAIFIADLAYLLGLFCYLGAFLLLLEWFVHLLPGSSLNSARRLLFLASFPLLEWSESVLPLKWGGFKSRGLFTAVLFLIIARYLVPWLVLFSFSMRG